MCKLLCNPVTVKVSRVISVDVMVRTTGLIYGVYDTKQCILNMSHLIELKELNVVACRNHQIFKVTKIILIIDKLKIV